MVLLPGTTRTQEPLGVVPRSMAHMAALEVGLPTTRGQELMLAGAPSMGHTDPVGLHKHGIRAQEPMSKPVRDRTSAENCGPVMFSEEITEPRGGGGFRRRKPEKCEEQGAERTGKEGRFTPAD